MILNYEKWLSRNENDLVHNFKCLTTYSLKESIHLIKLTKKRSIVLNKIEKRKVIK